MVIPTPTGRQTRRLGTSITDHATVGVSNISPAAEGGFVQVCPAWARLGGESPPGKLAVATPSKPQGEEAARAVRPRGRR